MTTLTIAHRAELAVHHTRELVLDGAGGHELSPLPPASPPAPEQTTTSSRHGTMRSASESSRA